MPVNKVALAVGTGQNTVIKWRNRFVTHGVNGLHDQPRSGKPAKYDETFHNRILQTLELPPPKGHARWDGQTIAKHFMYVQATTRLCLVSRAPTSDMEH